MKKRKLLFAAAMLLFTAGAWAQLIDVTSKYLTNASVTSKDGWTDGITANDANWTGRPDNVCLNHGWYFEETNMYQDVTLPAGSYRLVVKTRGHEDVNSNIYVYDLIKNTNFASADVTKNGVSGDDNGWGETTVEFTLTSEQQVRIGWWCAATNEVWANADYFKLYRLTDVTSIYFTDATFDNETARTADLNTTNATQFNSMSTWSVSGSGTWSSSAVFSYDSGVKLNGVTVPTTGPNNETTGKALGFTMGWAGSVQFTQAAKTSLPAGHYTLTYYTYNGNASKTQIDLKVGFGDNLQSITSIASGSWIKQTYSFDLTAATSGNFQIQAKPKSGGSNDNAKVFLDGIALTYSPFADSDDYSELATAISTVEVYSPLGFDAGEYAPYNLAHALTNAKAIDSFVNNPLSVVREAIDALYAITANADEVDAVYNGNFATVTIGQNYPDGWTRTNGWGQIQSGLTGSYSTAYYNQPGSLKYGDTGYFTMPLKADTYYTLEVAYRSHENNNTNVTVSVLKGEEGLAATGLDWTSSKTDWTEQQVVFKTGAAGDYLLTLANYGNTWMTGVSLRRATAEEVKTLLSTELATANDLYKSGANVGSGVFQIPTADGNTFNVALTSAQIVYDDTSATVVDVATAISSLQSAIETFKEVEINAPADDTKYYIKVATTGHAKLDNAWLLAAGATSNNNPTGYTIQANNAPAEHLAQAWTFTRVSGNSYKISMDLDGITVYLTNGTINGSAAGWKASQIQGTTEESEAMAFKIEAGNQANTFYIYNTETNSTIACQDGGNIYTEAGNAYFSVSEASQASVEVSVKAGKLATRIFPFKPTSLSGVEFYSCAECSDNFLRFEEVTDPVANVPYILYSEEGYNENGNNVPLAGWGTATADTYTQGLLTGVLKRTVVPQNSYVLQTQEDVQAFYKVDKTGAYSSPYRVYVTVPETTEVKAFGFTIDDMETAIEAARAEGESTVTLHYNVAGQQIQNLQKGLNIIKMEDGSVRKVLVK